MRSQRRLVSPLSAVNLQPNTFIGGVAAEIPTAASLATKLAISESDISYFAIVGSDIEARINVDYPMPGSSFLSNTAITYFNDADGLVTSLGSSSFSNATNLVSAKFKNATTSGIEIFRQCASLTELVLTNMDSLDSVALFRVSIVELILPNLTKALNAVSNSSTSGCFREMGSVTLIDMPKCTQIGRTALDNGVFLLIKTGCVINVDSSLATNNSGAMDGDLAYAVNSRGATVNFIVNT